MSHIFNIFLNPNFISLLFYYNASHMKELFIHYHCKHLLKKTGIAFVPIVYIENLHAKKHTGSAFVLSHNLSKPISIYMPNTKNATLFAAIMQMDTKNAH